MTGAEFGPLGFGAANLGNLYREVTDDQARATLEAAWDSGIRYFDTAPHYGLGLSERRLGAFLGTKPRSSYVISTKVGRLLEPNPDGERATDMEHAFAVPATLRRVWDFSPAGIRRSLSESLTRLGLDSVDILYLHDPERYNLEIGLGDGLQALSELREQGEVRAIGIGSMSTPALLAAARSGSIDVLMVAGRYTMLEQPAAAELIPECRARGIDVVAAGVFNSGLLASPQPSERGHYEYGPVPPELLDRARELARLSAEHGVDLPTAALQFALREPAVRTVVVGAGTPEQVRQNASRMATAIPESLWDALLDRGLVSV